MNIKVDKKFIAGDETDRQLVITIAHQFLRAESAFARFVNYSIGNYPAKKVLENKYQQNFCS